MDDSEQLCLRELIVKALEQCKDTDLLDLVYKILITDDIR